MLKRIGRTPLQSLVRLLVLIGCLHLNGHAAATQEISPGVLYQGGTPLSVSSLGIRFTVPRGWQALLPQGSEMLIMEPTEGIARMIITAVPGSNDNSVRQLMSQTQALDMSSQLVPAGAPSKNGDLYSQRYSVQGANPQNLGANAWAKLGSNQTAFYTILLEPEASPRFASVGKNLVSSVAFSQPAQASAQGESANINWEQRLKGRALRYMKTSSGYSVDKRFNLCSDYSFVYSDNDSYISNDATSNFSAASQGGNSGRWKINGNRITLSWQDGTASDYTLSRRYVEDWGEWGTFVDEERWFETANNACY